MNADLLTPDQIAFLKAFGGTPLAKKFYLTGGTPLAAFYLEHRYSEDLDFFSEEEIDIREIQQFLEAQKVSLGITSVDLQQSFNRNLLFIELPGGVVKTEFTYFPFTPLEKNTRHEYGVTIDTPLDIAVNKLFTIYSRTKARDYIDLYLLCQRFGYTIQDLAKLVRQKFDTHLDNIQLGPQFMKAETATDYPRMITDLAPSTWQAFFKKEAERLAKESFI